MAKKTHRKLTAKVRSLADDKLTTYSYGTTGVSIAWTSWENTPDRARIVRKEDGQVFAMSAFPDGILLTASIYDRPLKAEYSCLANYTKLDGTPCATPV